MIMLSSCHVSDIIYYPVKSLKGIHVQEADVDDFGLVNDRRFMLIDANDKFVTQRTHPKLALIEVQLQEEGSGRLARLTLSSPMFTSLTISFSDFIENKQNPFKVVVWGEQVDALVLQNQATDVLSGFLGEPVRLAYMPASSFRQIDRQFFSEDKRVSFADGYPFLLVSEASIQDLNTRLAEPVSSTNFRPNIVIAGDISPYAEDVTQRITIGEISFEMVKPCSRCIMTTINAAGEKSHDKEPLKTLSTYRLNEFGICFGQNLVHLTQGKIRVGDEVSFE